MRPIPSPLEHLTAFAIAFAAGILSTASIVAYLERQRQNAVRDRFKSANSEVNLPVPLSASINEVK